MEYVKQGCPPCHAMLTDGMRDADADAWIGYVQAGGDIDAGWLLPAMPEDERRCCPGHAACLPARRLPPCPLPLLQPATHTPSPVLTEYFGI